MAKPYSSRIVPLGELVLVRKTVAQKTTLAVAERGEDGKMIVSSAGGTTAKSIGIVVEVGPGSYEAGTFVKVDERIKAGSTVMFPAEASFYPKDIPEMAEEGLWLVPASAILAVILPEGMPAASTRKLTPVAF